MVREIVRYWCRRLRSAAVDAESDELLLRRFAAGRDEVAFEALVRRHGPMVWGVCQRILFHHQDAEDAFQAAFLVLARKAATAGRSGRLANWLFGVARRTAWNVRRRRERRARLEQPQGHPIDLPAAAPPPGPLDRAVVDEEIARLPDRYRLPIVLCCVEGMTHAEAGERLSWPTGTVAGRLSRGREMLKDRLRRRGIDVAAFTLGLTAAADGVAVPLRDESVAALARSALAFANPGAAAAVPDGVRAVAEATLREVSPLRSVLILSGFAGVGLGLAGLTVVAEREFTVHAAAPIPPGPTVMPANPRPRDVAGERGVAAPLVPLPPDGDAVVVRWESIDEKAGRLRHRLTVHADGRVEAVAPPSAGPGSPVRGRLSAGELQDLLRFVVHDQEFFAFDARALDRDLRRAYVYDGTLNSPYDRVTTRVRVRTADREHDADWHQLASAAVVFPEADRLHQLVRVERRLRNVLLVLAAGGPERVGLVADWATRRLRPTYPDLAPFTATDLSYYLPAADGSGARFAFTHGDKLEDEGYFSATVLVPGQGPPTLGQVTPGPPDVRPAVFRRPCGSLPPGIGSPTDD
jgi:RNA polymerase sigma factor (sigma-70 family)